MSLNTSVASNCSNYFLNFPPINAAFAQELGVKINQTHAYYPVFNPVGGCIEEICVQIFINKHSKERKRWPSNTGFGLFPESDISGEGQIWFTFDFEDTILLKQLGIRALNYYPEKIFPHREAIEVFPNQVAEHLRSKNNILDIVTAFPCNAKFQAQAKTIREAFEAFGIPGINTRNLKLEDFSNKTLCEIFTEVGENEFRNLLGIPQNNTNPLPPQDVFDTVETYMYVNKGADFDTAPVLAKATPIEIGEENLIKSLEKLREEGYVFNTSESDEDQQEEAGTLEFQHDQPEPLKPAETELALLLEHYGLEWSDFLKHGCYVKDFQDIPCIVYPTITVEDKTGTDYFKYRSIARIDKGKRKAIHNKYVNGSYDENFSCSGFFPTNQLDETSIQQLYICGGEEKALALIKSGFRAISITTGESLDRVKARFLIKKGIRHFALAFDYDNAGIKGTQDSCDNLYKAASKAGVSIEVKYVLWEHYKPTKTGYDINDLFLKVGCDTNKLLALLNYDRLAVLQPTPIDTTGEVSGNEWEKKKAEEWGEIVPFEQVERLPKFPMELYDNAPWLQNMIRKESVFAGMDCNGGALMGLTLIASCVAGHGFVVSPENRHTQPVSFYNLMVGESGDGKSSLFSNLKKPLKDSQNSYVNNPHTKREISENIHKVEAMKAQIKELKKELKSVFDNPEENSRILKAISAMEEEIQNTETELPNFFGGDDTTLEALEMQLLNETKGMHILNLIVDEFSTALNNIGGIRHNVKTPETGLYKKGFSGEDHETRRLGRGVVKIDRALLNIFGVIQPESLKHYMKGGVSNPLISEGFFSRFFFVFFDEVDGAKPDEETAKKITDDYAYNLKQLHQLWLGMNIKVELELDPESAKAWKEFDRELKERRRNKDHTEFNDYGFKAWFKKLRGNIFRIAAIFHVLRHHDRWIHEREICLEDFNKAKKLINEFLIPHAKRAFIGSSSVQSGETDASLVWDKILDVYKKKKSLTIFPTDILRKLDNPKNNKNWLFPALEILEDMSYIKILPGSQVNRKIIQINPKAVI